MVAEKEAYSMDKLKKMIPVCLSLFLIFGLTFQNGSASKQLTENTQAVIGSVITSNPTTTHWWNDYMLMRKVGHLVEYIPLGFSSCFAFSAWRALIFCAGVSFVDQFIKGILPGREFDLRDMPFDFAGYVIGIVIVVIVMRIRRKKSSRTVL